MLKWIETTGKNEDEAISVALKKLGMDRDDVSVEVIDRAKTGFLGIGSAPAKVRVSYEVPDEVVEEVAPPTPVSPKVEKIVETPAAPVVVESPAPVATAPVSTEPVGEQSDAIATFLTGLMTHMNVAATPKIEMGVDGSYKVELVGENLGAIIGRRGETLDAIQQLTSYAVNRGQAKRCRIHLDAERYRAKREESLIHLANKVATKVVKYRRNVTLEPMNAYERHVIHTALQDNNQVETFSVGTEPNRRTVVTLAKK